MVIRLLHDVWLTNKQIIRNGQLMAGCQTENLIILMVREVHSQEKKIDLLLWRSLKYLN